MEGKYEIAIIDKTSTQQKLEHGQRWIWHPRSRADREAQKINHLFPNCHYMFVIQLYCILHFFSKNFKTELLCDCVVGFIFQDINLRNTPTLKKRHRSLKQPKWPPSWNFMDFQDSTWRPGTIWRIYWLYPPLPLPQSWRHVEDLLEESAWQRKNLWECIKEHFNKTQCEKNVMLIHVFQAVILLDVGIYSYMTVAWDMSLCDVRREMYKLQIRLTQQFCSLCSSAYVMSQVTMTTQLSKNVTLNSPLVAAPMDTVTEAVLCQCRLQSKCHE